MVGPQIGILHTRLGDYTPTGIIAYSFRRLCGPWTVSSFANIFSQFLGLSKLIFSQVEMDVKTNLKRGVAPPL